MATEFFKRQMRVLHLEDNENDHVLVREMLRADGLPCELVMVKTRPDFESALRHNGYDLIISDFSLPSYDGLSALSLARELSPQTPFIFFSGTIGEEVAVESLRNGAADYILKQRPQRLLAAVRNALRGVEERTRRRRAESDLRKVEESFHIISRVTNDVVWEWDIMTDTIWFSENFKIAFGHSPEETGATRERWLDLFHPDDRGRIVSGMTALLAGGGRVWWSEHRMRRADGTYAHILDRASIVYDSANKPLRMVGVTIDLTERKHAEEKIREQAALLDKAQDAIIVCDLNDRIIYWNRGAERIYGWNVEEAIGQDCREFFFQGAPAVLNEIAAGLEQRGEWNGELQQADKYGRPVIVYSRWTRVRDEKSKPKSKLIISTDITERKLLEEQFLRAQRLESLGVLVSGIAHDLNNMLVPIVVGVDILRAQSISEDAEAMLQTMEASARRSTDMIKQMLTFARGGEASKALIHVDKLVKEMGKIVADTFPKSIQCRVRVDKSSRPVFGLPTQLHQILLNLCVNARDAMPDGGTLTLATENVKLSPEEAARHKDIKPGNYLCISVADTGAGMPPETLDKIFQPFFTTKAPGKGTGLGLSTCQSIAKNHNGFITVHSKVKSGTEFKVYLPAADIAPPEPAVARTAPPPSGNGERILVVDDEESILAITRAALENYGYTVLTENSGLEAVTRFSEKPDAVDLVITDLAMPFMDGRAMIAALRKIRPDLKIIIASGSDKEIEEAKRTVKVEAFVAKPFTNDELLEAVHEVLSRKK
jgi:PAS domain S-box-containing protein